MYRHWQTYEIEELANLAPKKTYVELSDHFDRSIKSIRDKCYALKIQAKDRRARKYYSKEFKDQIYEYFISHNDNRSIRIADHFNISEYVVNKILDEYL